MEGESRQTLKDTNIRRNYTKFLVFIGFVLVLFSVFLIAWSAQAATLYFSPASGSYQVGQTFSVGVYVSSPEQAMNAASGVISFPQDKLEVVSLAKSGSIISLWVQEPSFSNSSGVVNFEGIVLNPGFQGSAGKIVTIDFKAKSAGSAPLSFNSGSVLANDGKGTNILTGLGSASFNLTLAPMPPSTPTPPERVGPPAAPQISSPTHPDPNKWYSQDKAEFKWNLPADVTGVSILLDQKPTSNPGPLSDGLFSSKTYEKIEDGILYLHLKLRNASGWGPISHFRCQIDTEPPEQFSIEIIDGQETDNPRPTAVFDTVDALSGIDYYKVKIGEGDAFPLPSEEVKGNPYTLPLQSPGKRTILVQAFDKAGNYTTAVEDFVIKPLKAPVIVDYPQKLTSDEPLEIEGTTIYPNARVTLWLQRGKEEPSSQMVRTDEEGNFTVIYGEKLKDGVYKMWAQVVDERGAKSRPSEEVTFAVSLPKVLKIGKIALDYLTLIITLIVLIIGVGVVIFYSWYRISLWRKRVRKQTIETAERVHHAFNALKEEVEEQVSRLDGLRGLSKREKQISEELKKALEISEKYISKKIKDIGKKLK